MPSDAATVPPPYRHPTLLRARRLLWLVFLFLLLGIGIGGAWDRAYHVTNPFDTFLSPPHLFIYGMVLVAMLLTVVLVFAPTLRPWFGKAFPVPLLPFAVSGALVLLAGGLLAVALAGALDDLWHTAFGLDETGWSTPHSMLAWGLLVTFLGLVACRLALARHRPLSRPTPYILAFFVLAFSVTPFLGPLYGNHAPETVRAVAAIPVLAAQPEAQHTFRIYLHWNLDRTNPLFPPLAALWAGFAFALVQRLDGRPRVLLSITLISSVVSFLGDRGTARFLDPFYEVSANPAAWLPVPIFPAAILLVLLQRRKKLERWTWTLTGLAFGLLTLLIWGRQPLAFPLALAGALTMPFGARIGARVHRILIEPSRRDVLRFVPLAGLAMPLLTGLVDLALRTATP